MAVTVKIYHLFTCHFCFDFSLLLKKNFFTNNKNNNSSTNMGNTNCVADGGCPQRADIVIANNTKYELNLDIEESCGRECDHKGKQKYVFHFLKKKHILF